MEAKDEKEAKDPEEHATGAGTEQAGTGDAEGEIPDRKDLADQMVDAKEYTDEWLSLMEQELAKDEEDMKDEEDEEDEEAKKKDVTKEGFPAPIKVSKDRSGNKQYSTDLEETFRLFEKEIE